MLFPFISQRIADYLNMDEGLERRKAVFCILNMTSSGGIMGIFLILVLWRIGRLNRWTLMTEFAFVFLSSAVDSLIAFPRVNRRVIDGQKRSRRFVFLCFLPMFLYLLVMTVLLIYN